MVLWAPQVKRSVHSIGADSLIDAINYKLRTNFYSMNVSVGIMQALLSSITDLQNKKTCRGYRYSKRLFSMPRKICQNRRCVICSLCHSLSLSLSVSSPSHLETRPPLRNPRSRPWSRHRTRPRSRIMLLIHMRIVIQILHAITSHRSSIRLVLVRVKLFLRT